MDNDKIITFEIPKGYRFKHRIYDEFVFEKMNDRPTDIKDAAEILDISMFRSEDYRMGQLYALQQLLIFRDAWWKMADDWKPDWNEETDKFTISNKCNKIYLNNTAWHAEVLSFPTAEMRDKFYDNFKELINEVKELL